MENDMSNQTKNNSLNYLIDSTVTTVNTTDYLPNHLKMKMIEHLFKVLYIKC